MNKITVLIVILLLLAYIISILAYVRNSGKRKELQILMNATTQKYRMKTFSFEDQILERLNIKDPNRVKYVLYIERFLIIAAIGVGIFFFRGLALAGFGAIIVVLFFDDAYKKVVYESGITNISRVTNFINYFVPHINSGNSADQSLLGYIEYSKDEELAAYYENRDNPEFEISTPLKQIVDIYDIAKYNEEQGISDYTYILNELSQDMAQKQVYYNNFVSRISEIGPIMWSYYLGVPILIVVSFAQTYEFWLGMGGLVVAIILLALFTLFKFLIYKLQKKTITVIF